MAETGNAEELRSSLREKAQSSLYFFSKVVLNYDALTDYFHLPFCNHIQNSIPKLKRGYLLPRGHFKSTIVAKSYPLWRLGGGGYSGKGDPRDLRIFLGGESSTVAEKNLRDMKWNLLHNELFQWLFPELIPPDVNNTKWTDSEILLPRTHSYDESSITADGVGAKRTGFHFDIIIYDDLIGEKAAKSEAEMQGARTWVQYATGLLNDQSTGEELFIGTRWKHGTADLYGYIMANMPEFEWYIRAVVEEGEIVFPDRFTEDKLKEIRRRQGAYKYACQYENNPTSPEGADFQPEWIKEYRIGDDNKTIIFDDGTPPTQLGQLVRMSFYDPSSGGKTATAENAIIVAGMDSLRRIIILAAWSQNCPYGVAIEKWMKLNDQFIPYKNHYELVAAQKAIEDIARERNLQVICRHCEKAHRRLTPIPIKPPGGRHKEERIRSYAQAPFEHGRVYLRFGMTKLRQQILNFPHGDMVDMFDALAYLCNLLRPPLSEEQIVTEREVKARMDLGRKSCIATEYQHGGYA